MTTEKEICDELNTAKSQIMILDMINIFGKDVKELKELHLLHVQARERYLKAIKARIDFIQEQKNK